MQLKVTTWNINSVRLRIDLVAKFIKSVRPDVLCLQETKCPDDAFPLKRFRRLGYEHIAINGQKGYHGVAVVSRLPFESDAVKKQFCGKTDSRHIGVVLGEKAGLKDPLTRAQYLHARGRRRARSEDQSEIRAQAVIPRRAARVRATCCPSATSARSWSAISTSRRSSTTSGVTRQLLKVVSHTPIECEKLIAAQKAGNWIDVARNFVPRAGKAVTPGGAIARRIGRPPTRAAGSTTSGCRRRSATAWPASRSPRMRAAGSGRRTMFR